MPLRSFFLLLSSFEKVTLLQHSVLNYQSAHGLIIPTACAFPWRRHSFVFQRSCQFVLIFYPCRKSVFRDTILCCHVLFVIPFSKSFKTLHFTPIGLLLNLVFWAPFFSRKEARMVCLNSRRFVYVFKNRMHDSKTFECSNPS